MRQTVWQGCAGLVAFRMNDLDLVARDPKKFIDIVSQSRSRNASIHCTMYDIVLVHSLIQLQTRMGELEKHQPLFAVVQITQSPSSGLSLGGVVQGSVMPFSAGTARPLSSLPSRPTL